MMLGAVGCYADSENGKEIRGIDLEIEGWRLSARPDGSASIGRSLFRSTLNFQQGRASVPAKTVDFDRLLAAVKADFANPDPVDELLLTAVIRIKGEHTFRARLLHDPGIWNELIAELDPKFEVWGEFRKETEEFSLKVIVPPNPLAPGQKQQPYRDDKGQEIARVELLAMGWWLSVRPDGSAGIMRNLENDSSAMASVPPQTLDFEPLVKALKADLEKPKFNLRRSPLRGGMRKPGQDTHIMSLIHDWEMWNRLIAELDPKFEGQSLASFRKKTVEHPLKLVALENPAPRRVELAAMGWRLTVRPDGSATIMRFMENDDSARASAPPKTLDFESLVKALEADLENPKSDRQPSPLLGGIRMTGQVNLAMRPILNLEIWNRLIAELEPKFEGRSFASFRKKTEDHPLKLAPPANPATQQKQQP